MSASKKMPDLTDPLLHLDRELDLLESESPTATWDPHDTESMLDWLEGEIGMMIRGVPKVEAIMLGLIGKLQRRERIRVAVIGPRGGGKTMLAAAIQLLSVRFYGASWTSLGGSLEQANRLFWHVRTAIQRSDDLQSFIAEALATRITGRNGGTITVHAASERSIRGQHPRGPSGAGGVVLDEASLIEDRIIEAAIPQVASADPSMILQLSTLGERQTGRFWELTNDPAARGYDLHEFGIFDVARRCHYDCKTTCPVPAFHEDQHTELPGGGLEHVQKALCGGRAHRTDGWIPIDEIVQQFKDLPLDSFCREFLGTTSSRVGAVYSTESIDEATAESLQLARDMDQHRHRLVALEKAIGIDWGYAGETWAVYLLRMRNVLVAYRWESWHGVRFSRIREHLLQRIIEEQISYVLPDSANPSDNDELANLIEREAQTAWDDRGIEMDCQVTPVKFSTEKSYGIGEVRRRLEGGKIIFPCHFGGAPVPNVDRALRLLKAYSYDQNGLPMKKDDHACDALLCGVIQWSPRWCSNERAH